MADPGNVLCTGTILHCQDKLVDQLPSILEGGKRGEGRGRGKEGGGEEGRWRGDRREEGRW